ncbi:hypothetical protein [Kiloniella majae]|uniref:hypothetical protein n=1 Tax=Kiloniella majae TaxID=1938558 RepID=UPI000A278D33|nr:hypothetical protein [Kiloniella majae]
MSKNKAFSFLRGYSFTFEDEGKEIRAWFSALSGLEQVYVDNKLVSSQRSFSRNSTNEFNIGSNCYSINMKAESLLKGPFVCTLSKNRMTHAKQKIVITSSQRSKQHRLLQILVGLGLGIAYIFFERHWQIPSEYFYYFIAAVVLISMMASKSVEVTIEEETI